MLPLLLCLALAPQAPAAPASVPSPAGDTRSVEELRDTLRRQGDHPDPLLVRALAAEAGPAALAALEELLGAARGRDARVLFVRSFVRFASEPGTRKAALERLLAETATLDYPVGVTIPATAARDRAVAIAAVEAIALFGADARELLADVARSPGDREVRAAALSAHGRAAGPKDLGFYRELLHDSPDYRPIDLASGVPLRYPLELRVLAVTLAGPFAKADELLDWSRAPETELALVALAELGRRGGRAFEDAAELHFRSDARDSLRLAAARLLLVRGTRGWRERVVDQALQRTAEHQLGPGLVRILAEYFGERGASLEAVKARAALVDYTVLQTRSGRGWTRLAGARALVAARGPDVIELGAKLRSDRDPRVRAAAFRAAGLAGDRALLPELLVQLGASAGPPRGGFGGEPAGSGDPGEEALLEEQLALVEAVALLGGGSGAVVETLAERTRWPSRPLRNAALEWLARTSGNRRMDALAAALRHPDWSTRLAAVRALALTESPRAVPFLIQALALADTRLAREAAAVLESWTGREHGTDPRPWRVWWAGAKRDWRLLPLGERGATSPRQHSRAEFFGASLGSDRVAFVIDRSGSMGSTLERARGDPTRSRARFRAETRMERARRELAAALEALGPGATVQIVVFDDMLRSLWPEAVVLDEEHLAEALEFVQGLRAGGGTNLHGGLWRALAESRVDTLVLLSDGEPSSGTVLSPSAIREAVRRWNRYRGYVVHGVAVGGGLSLVRWLTEDAGGTLVRVP